MAALVSALLALGAVMALSPSTASADNFSCDPGEFCLGNYYHLTGGLYGSQGSDADLRNDTYWYYANPALNVTPVAWPTSGNSWSAFNHGVRDASGRNDVLVYTWPGYTGHVACIGLGRKLDLPASWKDRIMSLRWVTHSECVAAGVL